MTNRSTTSRRGKAPDPILTPRLLFHQSEPYTDNVDVEGHWNTDQFTRYGVEVQLVSPDDSTTVRIGHVLMFSVGLVDDCAWEMAEYYSISLTHMVEFFIDDPLSDEWGWINDGMRLTSRGEPVIVLPAPLEFPGRPNSDPPTARWAGYEHARARITANYRRIGFRNYVRQAMLLDTGSDIAAAKLIRAAGIHGEADLQWVDGD
ncbi:MAG: hypothetical protein WBC27_00310 [Candidatus Nanopelagicales bacterium]